MIATLCGIALVAGAIVLRLFWRQSQWGGESLSLVATEHPIASRCGPHDLRGRLDAIYRNAAGQMVPVEYKSRNGKTYPGDLLQLSIYGWMLRKTGQPAAGYGFVVTGTGIGRKAARITLYGDAQVEGAIHRFADLAQGHSQPNKRNDRMCRSCSQRTACRPA